MTIRNLTKGEILDQIKYLEQNISNGSVSYRTNRLNRIRTLRASLRLQAKDFASPKNSRKQEVPASMLMQEGNLLFLFRFHIIKYHIEAA